jgi:hypothetical protein
MQERDASRFTRIAIGWFAAMRLADDRERRSGLE